MRQHIFIRAGALSLLLLILNQFFNALLAWGQLPLTKMPLVVLVFMIAINAEARLILLTAGLTGMFLDFWSGNEFGINALAFTLTIFISMHIFQKMLTNKSAGALVLLGAAATLIYCLFIFIFFLGQLPKETEIFWRIFADNAMRGGLYAITHSVILLLFFTTNRIFSKRMHPNYVRTT